MNATMRSVHKDGSTPLASFRAGNLVRRIIDGTLPPLNAYYVGKHQKARDLYLVRARHEVSQRKTLVKFARMEHREYLMWANKRGAK